MVDKFGHMKDANAPSKVKISYPGLNHGYVPSSDVSKRATGFPERKERFKGLIYDAWCVKEGKIQRIDLWRLVRLEGMMG